MIRLISLKTSNAIWEIDGITLSLKRLKSVGDENITQMLYTFKSILTQETYRENINILISIASKLENTTLIKIGTTVYPDNFIKMFEFYALEYIKEWDKSNFHINTKKTISYLPVFEFMFQRVFVYVSDANLNILKCTSFDNQIFENSFNDIFNSFYARKINDNISQGNNLYEIAEKLKISKLSDCMALLPEETLKDFFKSKAKIITKKREVITLKSIVSETFGEYSLPEKFTNDKVYKIIRTVTDDEYLLQKQIFVSENKNNTNVENDIWKIFEIKGPSIIHTTFDFSKIKSSSLKLEVKYFIKHKIPLNITTAYGLLNILSKATNLAIEINSDIHFFSDIDDITARAMHMRLEKYWHDGSGNSVTEISRMFSALSCVIEYLKSDRRDKKLRTPKPYNNPFLKIRFHNVNDYKIPTKAIPEEVAEALDMYINEIEEPYQLLHEIFYNTGMRLKDVLFLENDCIRPSKYEGFKELHFKVHKTISVRRKKGASDYHSVIIFDELAEKIKCQIDKTAHYQEQENLPYIFLNKYKKARITMINMDNYSHQINDLIKKYNLCDETGRLWRFTVKQQRKTLAVRLIENGATIDELVYWLGHLNRNTAKNYYSDVRKKKLAEMNTEFFKEKFDLILSKEVLNTYSEEERKLLYMDFRLNERRVEFGYCIKKLGIGGCNNRNSMYNCINCKNLCTGKKYLMHFENLLCSQVEIIKTLEKSYKKENIVDYHKFKEYTMNLRLLKAYENVVKSIKDGD